jgi:hypothetical protein
MVTPKSPRIGDVSPILPVLAIEQEIRGLALFLLTTCVPRGISHESANQSGETMKNAEKLSTTALQQAFSSQRHGA